MADPLADLAAVLERAGIPYAVIGAHAVNVWIEPRFTADIDVAVQASADDLERLRALLKEHGYTVAREFGGMLPSGPDIIRCVASDGVSVVKLQIAKSMLQREIIRRAISAGSGAARVATVEDLIVMKLIADRPKDHVDLMGLIALPDIDWEYIEHWAREWDVLDRLRRVRPRNADD